MSAKGIEGFLGETSTLQVQVEGPFKRAPFIEGGLHSVIQA